MGINNLDINKKIKIKRVKENLFMGLDMYLEKIHRDVVCYMDVEIEELDKTSELYKKLRPYIKEQGKTYKWISLFEEVGYWRKANAIHNWFVNNIQNGKDDCRRYEVSKENLNLF